MPSTLIFSRTNQDAGLYEAEPSSTCRVIEYCSLVLICALLMFGPLAFGAVQAWSASVLHVGAALLLMLWAIRQVFGGSIIVFRHPLFLPTAVFGGYICLQFALRIPVYPSSALQGALNLVAYGMVMFAASQIFREESSLRRFMLSMTAFGFANAVFAAAQNFSAPGKLYWSIVPKQGGWVFGSYVNHNHYAGLIELLLPVPLVLAFRSESWSKRVLFGFVAATMISSVVLSQSRGGMAAIACEVLFVILAVTFKKTQRRPLGALLIVLLVTASMLTWMAGTSLKDRIDNTKEELEATGDTGIVRVLIVKDSVDMIKERPLMGWGLRMFPVVFPKYRSFYTNQFVNEAHNDYLQYLVETGIVGFGIILAFLGLMVRHSIGYISQWQRSGSATYRFSALTACIGILVHSFTDFNLQIPANAVLFLVMCVIASGRSDGEAITAVYPIRIK